MPNFQIYTEMLIYWRNSVLFLSGTTIKEKDFPDELYAHTFSRMRKLGAKVKTYYDMHVRAIQLKDNKLLIDRLRTYGGYIFIFGLLQGS